MSDLTADSLNQPVVDYADVADLYELCACRKEQTMRVCRSHEALRRERDAWLTHNERLQSMTQSEIDEFLAPVVERYLESHPEKWQRVT